jgi:hypothetical protein
MAIAKECNIIESNVVEDSEQVMLGPDFYA